jgi:hypothetical protein
MPDISLADLASPEVPARARKIKLFLMDVDGTLADGGVCLISGTAADGSGAPGVSVMKIFNAKDGQGLSLLSGVYRPKSKSLNIWPILQKFFQIRRLRDVPINTEVASFVAILRRSRGADNRHWHVGEGFPFPDRSQHLNATVLWQVEVEHHKTGY